MQYIFLVLNKCTKDFLKKYVYKILQKKGIKLVRCIFLVLNKCTKYYLKKKLYKILSKTKAMKLVKKKIVQNIVKKKKARGYE